MSPRLIGHQIPKPLQSTRERPTRAIDPGLPPPSRFVYGLPSSVHRVRSTATRVGRAHDAARAWTSSDQPLMPCDSPFVTRYSVTRYSRQGKAAAENRIFVDAVRRRWSAALVLVAFRNLQALGGNRRTGDGNG